MAITDFFDRGWRHHPAGTAYVLGERSWTFDEAGRLSCRIANALLAAGAGRETKAAVLAPNDPVAWICVLGLWRAGLTWVPLNPARPAEDTRTLVDRFDCEIVFYHPTLAAALDEIRPRLPKVTTWVDLAGLDDWLGEAADTPPRVPIGMDDVAAICSTGGTTGLPKGVMNTHRNLATTVAHLLLALHYDADQPVVNLAAAPMSHASGVLTLPVSARGGTVVVLDRFDTEAVVAAVERHGITEVFLPPTVIYRLLELPGIGERDLSSLRYLLYSSAPMSTDRLRRALEVFGPVLVECYGQVEAFAAVSYLRPEEHYVDGRIAPESRLASCGRPYPLVAAEIRDDADRPVPAGTPGEICVRGDLVMKGYYRDPEQTALTIVDGWLHTGDIGHFDDEGYLFITDRKKDMIISGGFNVYPSEVEQVLWGHPAVQDCAVVGVPSDEWGEAVKAVVELNPGASATEAELVALCRERLGGVRAPKSVDFVEALPRSPNGKVLKKDVRARYWAGRRRRI